MMCRTPDDAYQAGLALAATFPPLPDDKVQELARILAPLADTEPIRATATTQTSAPAKAA